MPQEGLSPVFSPTGGSESSATTGWSGVPTEEHAEVLTGPLPVYPDLLRQAGVQGRVVLEAVVDTTGRVLAASILVVSRTNPGFVAPAPTVNPGGNEIGGRLPATTFRSLWLQ